MNTREIETQRCPHCGEESNDVVCRHCGRTNRKTLYITIGVMLVIVFVVGLGLLGMEAFLGAMMQPSLWRDIVMWGLGVFGIIILLVIVAAFVGQLLSQFSRVKAPTKPGSKLSKLRESDATNLQCEKCRTKTVDGTTYNFYYGMHIGTDVTKSQGGNWETTTTTKRYTVKGQRQVYVCHHCVLASAVNTELIGVSFLWVLGLLAGGVFAWIFWAGKAEI